MYELVYRTPVGLRTTVYVTEEQLLPPGTLNERARRYAAKLGGKFVRLTEVDEAVPEARTQEKGVARHLLAAEALGFTNISSAVSAATAGLVASTVLHRFTGPESVYGAVTLAGQNLATTASKAVLDARVAARQAARSSLGATARAVATAADQAHASAAGASLSVQWTGLSLSKVTAWRNAPPSSLAAHLQSVEQPMQARVSRTASAETVHAFNDERRAAPRGDAATTWVWSAVLDLATCEACDALDGKSWRDEADIPMTPPVHPRCRCILIPVPRK